MSYVITRDDRGIYLGNAMGFAFWSKWDSIGLQHAVTFPSVEAAVAHISTWMDIISGVDSLDNYMFVPVQADSNGYASVAACINAGLEGWLDEHTETINVIPS